MMMMQTLANTSPPFNASDTTTTQTATTIPPTNDTVDPILLGLEKLYPYSFLEEIATLARRELERIELGRKQQQQQQKKQKRVVIDGKGEWCIIGSTTTMMIMMAMMMVMMMMMMMMMMMREKGRSRYA